MWFSSSKQLVSRKSWVIRRKLLLTTNSNLYTSFRLVPRSMTLNDIWRSCQPVLSFPRPISRKLYTICPQKLKLLIGNCTTAFRWYDCRWPWRYFKVIRLSHQISRKRCVIQQKLLQSINRKSYINFRLVSLLITLKDIWRSLQWYIEFQQSLAGFRVARSP